MDNSSESSVFSEMRPAEISWRDFFGSSLSLAPTLLSMYDELRMSGSKTSYVDEEEEDKSIPSNGNSISPQSIVPLSNRNRAVHESASEDGRREDLNEDNNNNNSSLQNLGELDFSLSESESSFVWSKPGSKASVPDSMTCGSLTVEVADDKKRPLSVTSTSSSSSSTCSLSCNHRKNLASCTMTSCCMVPSLFVVTGDDAVSDSQATASEASSGNSIICRGAPFFRAIDDCSVNYSSGQLKENPSFQRERFRSFSGCTAQAHPGVVWHETMLPTAKSDTAVMVLRITDGVPDVDTGQTPGNSEEETAVPNSESPYIDRVVMEILETERTYVKDLNDIIEGYVSFLCLSPEFDLQSSDKEALFGNIQDIFAFNRKFLKLLEEFGHDPIGVAECFVNQTEGFAIYSEYCTNYPRSMEVLTDCMKDEVKASILKGQQMLLKHALPLGSYLLKPVQRILKYHLLLLNILNHHDASSEGHEIIEQAVESMTSMARHINDMKQRHEHTIRTQEIQSMLYGWDGADLTTLGDLILEDKFRMCGAKALRSIFLFEKAVLIAKRREEGSLMVKAFIMCCNLMLIESIPKEPLCFHMIPFDCPRIQHTIQARSLEQKRLWCQHLKQLILDNYTAAIPDKAKELVMTLGKSREEEMLGTSAENVDHVKKQHSAPQYLQKWRGRRKSAGLIFDFKLKPRSGPRKSDPSAQVSPNASPKARRNSDVAEFLGDGLKIKEKSGHSPRLGLMKKNFFWTRDGSENSSLTLNTSADSIKSSLAAAHSAEAVCSFNTPSQSSHFDDEMSAAGRSVADFATIRIPKGAQRSYGPIRSTNIAHKDSIAITKTKYAASSGALNNKDLCRTLCSKTRSKSTVGLESEQELVPSDSSAAGKDDSGTRDGVCQKDHGQQGETRKPGNLLRVFLTSEDNQNTDLLADQCCTDESKSHPSDSITVRESDLLSSENEKLNRSDAVSCKSEDSFKQESRKNDEALLEVDQSLFETSCSGRCSKCGGSLPPFDGSRASPFEAGNTLDDRSGLAMPLCLDCASERLKVEMAHLDECCREADDSGIRNAENSSAEESTWNNEEHNRSDTESGYEGKDFEFWVKDAIYSLKEDQVKELAKHLMTSKKALLGANFPEHHDIHEKDAESSKEMVSTMVQSSAGSDNCSLSDGQLLKRKDEAEATETNKDVGNESNVCPDETEGTTNGIVDSLRNSVVHFLSKLTNRNQTESAKAKSTVASSVSGDKEEVATGTTNSKDARYRFVYYLARAYSNKTKQLEVKPETRKLSNSARRKSEKNKGPQLTMLLKGTELGSEIIGERMAQATPHTLGRTLSLVPRRKVKQRGQAARNDRHKNSSIRSDEGCLSSETANRDEYVENISSLPLENDDDRLSPPDTPQSTAALLEEFGLRCSEMDSEEVKSSFESFYEKQLSLDLDDGSLSTVNATISEPQHEFQLMHTV